MPNNQINHFFLIIIRVYFVVDMAKIIINFSCLSVPLYKQHSEMIYMKFDTVISNYDQYTGHFLSHKTKRIPAG